MDWACGRSRTSPLRLPMLFNLQMDPFARAEESEDCPRWRVDNAWAFVPAQEIVAQFLRASGTFHLVRNQAASASTRRYRRCSKRRTTEQSIECVRPRRDESL